MLDPLTIFHRCLIMKKLVEIAAINEPGLKYLIPNECNALDIS